LFETLHRKAILIILFAIIVGPANGGAFIKDLISATDIEKGAMCAPLLRKMSGIFEIPLSRNNDSPGVGARQGSCRLSHAALS